MFVFSNYFLNNPWQKIFLSVEVQYLFEAATYFAPDNRTEQHRICKGFFEGEVWNNGPNTRQLHSLFWP